MHPARRGAVIQRRKVVLSRRRYAEIVRDCPNHTWVSHHTSSTDPLGKGAGLLALVAAEPHWKDAVMTLLHTDYDCFFPELRPAWVNK